jgi:hypothetical protein
MAQSEGSTAVFGPEGFGGIAGTDGYITAAGGAKIAIMARWQIRRSGSYPDGRPRLRFNSWFAWKQDGLMAMCGRGELKGRVRLQMRGKDGPENIDIVQWDEWRLNEDGMLTLENILHFDTQPIK